jgi:hypothetical protein
MEDTTPLVAFKNESKAKDWLDTQPDDFLYEIAEITEIDLK